MIWQPSHSFVHSFVHSFIHLFVNSFIQYIHSIYSFMHYCWVPHLTAITLHDSKSLPHFTPPGVTPDPMVPGGEFGVTAQLSTSPPVNIKTGVLVISPWYFRSFRPGFTGQCPPISVTDSTPPLDGIHASGTHPIYSTVTRKDEFCH